MNYSNDFMDEELVLQQFDTEYFIAPALYNDVCACRFVIGNGVVGLERIHVFRVGFLSWDDY